MTDQLTAQTTFAVVPTWVIDHPELSDRAVRLYAVLARYADADQRAWPSRATLAGRLRCSPDSIDRAVRELTAAGAVAVTRRLGADGAPTSNLYVLAVSQPAGGGSRTAAAGGSRTAAAGVAAPVRHEREPVNESQSERKPPTTLAPADAGAQQQPAAIEPAPDRLPTRAVPGRTLTTQLVRWGIGQGHATSQQLHSCSDRVDVSRLALRIAEQHTEGTQAERVAHHLAAEYLAATIGADPGEAADTSVISPAARRLLGRLVKATTPGSLLRYLDLAVQAGAGLRDEDTDEALAVVKYASSVHRRERAEAARPAALR